MRSCRTKRTNCKVTRKRKSQRPALRHRKTLPCQASADGQLRFDNVLNKVSDPELRKRAQLFVMPKGQSSCFADPEIAVPFKSKIKEMLAVSAMKIAGTGPR